MGACKSKPVVKATKNRNGSPTTTTPQGTRRSRSNELMQSLDIRDMTPTLTIRKLSLGTEASVETIPAWLQEMNSIIERNGGQLEAIEDMSDQLLWTEEVPYGGTREVHVTRASVLESQKRALSPSFRQDSVDASDMGSPQKRPSRLQFGSPAGYSTQTMVGGDSMSPQRGATTPRGMPTTPRGMPTTPRGMPTTPRGPRRFTCAY